MILQLKEKFHLTKDRSEKIKILTVLPKSWSERKIAEEFETTKHTARVAKQVVAVSGVLSDPNPKRGRRVEDEIAQKVRTSQQNNARQERHNKCFCQWSENSFTKTSDTMQSQRSTCPV